MMDRYMDTLTTGNTTGKKGMGGRSRASPQKDNSMYKGLKS